MYVLHTCTVVANVKYLMAMVKKGDVIRKFRYLF